MASSGMSWHKKNGTEERTFSRSSARYVLTRERGAAVAMR
jgi:hypothetical protein